MTATPANEPHRRIDATDVQRAFEREIARDLNKIEADRVQVIDERRRRRWLVGAGLAAVTAAAIALFSSGTVAFEGIAIFGLFVVGVLAIVAFGWASAPVEAFTGKLQSHVMEIVCRSVGNVTYDRRAANFAVEPFDKNHLFASYNRTSKDHHLFGRYRDCDFEMAKVELIQKGSGKNSSSKTIFDGLLMRISVPKSTRGRVMIFKDHGTVFNSLGNMFTPGNRVEIPDAAFEAGYELYAEFPSDVSQFVTPAFVTRFMQLSELVPNTTVTAAFHGDQFYVALHGISGFLQALTAEKPASELSRAVVDVVDEISLIHRVIDTLHGVETASH